MTRNAKALLVLATLFVAMLFGGQAKAEVTTVNVPDGTIHEDDPRWDCRIMGNLVCGPNNSQGVPMGHYLTITLALIPE